MKTLESNLRYSVIRAGRSADDAKVLTLDGLLGYAETLSLRKVMQMQVGDTLAALTFTFTRLPDKVDGPCHHPNGNTVATHNRQQDGQCVDCNDLLFPDRRKFVKNDMQQGLQLVPSTAWAYLFASSKEAHDARAIAEKVVGADLIVVPFQCQFVLATATDTPERLLPTDIAWDTARVDAIARAVLGLRPDWDVEGWHSVPVRNVADMESLSCSSFQFATLETRVARFSAKTLANHATRIGNQLRNPSDRDTEVWKLIERVLAKENLALTTPATGKTRQQCVDEILAAARKPCPTVVERFSLLGTDGKYYFALGFPLGVKAVEPYERKSMGFVYQDPNGTTYGQLGLFPTAETLRASWEESQDIKTASFREILDKMTDSEVEAQAIYWLQWMRDDQPTEYRPKTLSASKAA